MIDYKIRTGAIILFAFIGGGLSGGLISKWYFEKVYISEFIQKDYENRIVWSVRIINGLEKEQYSETKKNMLFLLSNQAAAYGAFKPQGSDNLLSHRILNVLDNKGILKLCPRLEDVNNVQRFVERINQCRKIEQ